MNINNYGTVYIINPPPEASRPEGGARTSQVIPYSQRALGDGMAAPFDANAFGRSAASLLSAPSAAKAIASGAGQALNRATAYLQGRSAAQEAASGLSGALNRAAAYLRAPSAAATASSDAGALSNRMASLLSTPSVAKAMASRTGELSGRVASLLNAAPPSKAFASALGPAMQAISAQDNQSAASTQTLPQYWDPGKTYKPGDQVIYNGNIYQAPNQGGSHHDVEPGSDDSKWLYAGTLQNYCKQISAQGMARRIAGEWRSAVAPGLERIMQANAAQDVTSTTPTQTLPQYWEPGNTYKPGDQVVYDGNIYQAPNQGGYHRNVEPGSDDSKWLYAGTFQNYYKQISSQDASHHMVVELRNANVPALFDDR